VYAAGIYTFATNLRQRGDHRNRLYEWPVATWNPGWFGTGTGTAGVHTDAHALAFSAGCDELYAGSDGRSVEDRGSGNSGKPQLDWVNAGLSTAQFYPGFAYDGVGDSIGGTQDNGSITRTSAAGVWTNTACGGRRLQCD